MGRIEVAYRLPLAPGRAHEYASVLVLAVELQSRVEGLLVFDPSEMRIALADGRPAHVLDRPRALALLNRLTPVSAATSPASGDAARIRARVAAALLQTTVFGRRPLRGYVVAWADEGKGEGRIGRAELLLRRLDDRAAYRLVLKGRKGAGSSRRPPHRSEATGGARMEDPLPSPRRGGSHWNAMVRERKG